jgi:RNA polymerase sigma-70 factor (ECF subfamily)
VTTNPADADRLSALFEAHSRRVYAYAARHTDPETAKDVVAEVFLVAWRRVADIPEPALPWLLVAARNVVSNSVRSSLRQRRLAVVVAGSVHGNGLGALMPGADETAVERSHMLAALDALKDTEREALLLTAWDGLTARDAAVVAGCSTRAFEVRLSRARAHLDRVLAAEPTPCEVTR